MRGFRGDYLGFTYNNLHSSALGITRVSDGMVDKQLIPTQKDITITVENAAGQHYYGSNFTQRTFEVRFAFEKISEEQLLVLRQKMNDGKIHDLIFDEEPYKVYSAKTVNAPQIKYVCFSANNVRWYSGEGTINFVCYFPYGRSRYSYLEDYTITSVPEWTPGSEEQNVLSLNGIQKSQTNFATISYASLEENIDGSSSNITFEENNKKFFPNGNFTNSSMVELQRSETIHSLSVSSNEYINLESWSAASGLPRRSDGFGEFAFSDVWQGEIKLKNPGDRPAILKIWLDTTVLPNTDNPHYKNRTLNLTVSKIKGRDVEKEFTISNFKKHSDVDKYLLIDFYNGTLEGYYENINSSKTQTKNLYNVYLTNDFFSIESNEVCTIQIKLNEDGAFTLMDLNPQVEITYLYNN